MKQRSLTELDLATMLLRKLNGDTWTNIAYDLNVSRYVIRRRVSDALKLHMPKLHKQRRYRRKPTSRLQ